MLEAGDSAQQGSLATAGRTEQGEELVVGDVHRHVVEGWSQPGIVGIPFGDVTHFNCYWMTHNGAFL